MCVAKKIHHSWQWSVLLTTPTGPGPSVDINFASGVEGICFVLFSYVLMYFKYFYVAICMLYNYTNTK